MKTLQNDFTTPEQSQRLSKLGVPTDSANGILLHYAWAEENLDEKNWGAPLYLENNLPASQALDMYLTDQDEYDIAIPCWSVGRLMEIYLICKTNIAMGLHFSSNDDWGEDIIEGMCDLFSAAVNCGYIDFTKLEE